VYYIAVPAAIGTGEDGEERQLWEHAVAGSEAAAAPAEEGM
jgi:hypothetical protein